MKKIYLLLLFIIFVLSCRSPSFKSIGEFSIKRLSNGCIQVTDGIGRRFVLVPRDTSASISEDEEIIHIPVRRVVAYSGYNVSLLRGLGVLNTVVGVTHKKDYWTIKTIRQGLENGTIRYVGESSAIDYETLKEIRPEVVFTWNLADVPRLESMGIRAVVTTTKQAMDLETRMRFMEFLALFFDREKQARAFVKRVKSAIKEVHKRLIGIKNRPKVIWGDIYEKRVLVEPGNSWAAEMVKIAGGDYLFDDIRGGS